MPLPQPYFESILDDDPSMVPLHAYADDFSQQAAYDPESNFDVGAGRGMEDDQAAAEFAAREAERAKERADLLARLNAAPAYAQTFFDPEARRARWATLVSADGAEGSIAIRQQASLRATRLHAGDALAATLDPARRQWLHVATGEVAVGERVLAAGDALGFVDEAGELALRGIAESSDVLLFDLPA